MKSLSLQAGVRVRIHPVGCIAAHGYTDQDALHVLTGQSVKAPTFFWIARQAAYLQASPATLSRALTSWVWSSAW